MERKREQRICWGTGEENGEHAGISGKVFSLSVSLPFSLSKPLQRREGDDEDYR